MPQFLPTIALGLSLLLGCDAAMGDPADALSEDASVGDGSVAGDSRPAVDTFEADGATTIDAASADAAVPDAARPPPPEGLVPMFVASGYGGRTATSCDDGLTWHDRRLSDDDADHSEFVDKGIVYGNGMFVQLIGWGGDGDPSVQVSRNGIDWTRVMADSEGGILNASTIAFSDGAFVIASRRRSYASVDGLSWESRAELRVPSAVREGGGGGPFVILPNPEGAFISTDHAVSWRLAPECVASNFGGVGGSGGVAYAIGRLVLFARDGRYCMTEDGFEWSTGQTMGLFSGHSRGKLNFAGGAFRYMNGRSMIVSPDGENWSKVELEPAGVEVHAIAESDEGTMVGFDRNTHEFFRSDDAVTWESTGTNEAPTRLIRMIFGYGEPSEACPLPGD